MFRLVYFVAGLTAGAALLVPLAAFAQGYGGDLAVGGSAVVGSGVGSVIGSFVGAWFSSRAAVNKKWDAETRAEMHNVLSEGIQAHETRCLLSRRGGAS